MHRNLQTTVGLLLLMAIGGPSSSRARGADRQDPIGVRNRRVIAADTIACQRIPLGEKGDYKPSLVVLPSGELLATMFHGYRRDGGKILEQTLLFRSSDGGRTWSGPEKLDLLGREPYLTALRDGTVLVTGHLLTQDERNQHGYTHSYLHRSEDAGRNWTTVSVRPEQCRPRTTVLTTRNILQLADGSLLFGVSEHAPKSQNVFWRSTDGGRSWPEKYPAHFEQVPENYPWTILGEAHLWQAMSGKIYAILRVGANNSWPLTGTQDPGNNDQSERMIIYSSVDRGRNWKKVRDLGKYGQMYPAMLRLGQGHLLLTFTQRAIGDPLGVRASLGRETRDGFSFDLKRDQILVDAKTPSGQRSGGGFGPTVRLADGTLVTAYTYRDADDHTRGEVARWRLPTR